MSFNNIIIEKKENLFYITVNRPKNLNALNAQTIQELSEAIDMVNQDREIRVAILTGMGEKAFVAGADIKEFASYSLEQALQLASNGHKSLFNKIEQSRKPFIACVNGYALGGGCELAMACHIRIASPNAMFGLPEVSLGLIPGYGGTQRLVQLVGKGKALQMLMTAEMINADQALQYGLITNVVALEDLKPTAEKLAQKISKNAPLAVEKAIQAVNAFYEDGVDGLEKEIQLFGDSFDTQDFLEGTKAFIEKRKAIFKGE